MKQKYWITITAILIGAGFWTFGQETSKVRSLGMGPRVIPLLLMNLQLDQLGISPGDDVWFELEYCASPDGKAFFQEPGEKLWWVQDRPLLLLGSTGAPLQASLTSRASVFVRVFHGESQIQGSPFHLEPRKNGIAVVPDAKSLQQTLGKSLSTINGTYIAQVANYLANNLATLDVQGTSYSVDGYGPVIDNAGRWLGEYNGIMPGNTVHDPELRLIEAGNFVQGSTDFCALADEVPFTHFLTRSLLVMETEVTRQMWAALKTAQPSLPIDPSDPKSPGMNHPLQMVTWYEAVLFANLLSVERGFTRCYYKDASFTTAVTSSNYMSGSFYCNFDANGYRLPSEGEWEYFTRAGTTGPFSINEPAYDGTSCDFCIGWTFGNLETVATFCGNGNGPVSVGQKDANPWGLKDVHGSVYEWCWDWWLGSYPSGINTDYIGPTSGSFRVFRGGSWNSNARACRSAQRSSYTPDNRDYDIGFRLVRTHP